MNRRRTAKSAFAVAAIAAAMLVLTACGGGTSASSETTAEPAATTTAEPQASGDANAGGGNGGGDFREAIETYRTCMADNGVTLPEMTMRAGGGPGGGDGAPPSGMPTDMPTAMPSGAPAGGGGFPGGGFPGGGFNQKPDDVDQATWDAAVSACADVAPSFPAGGFGGPGGGQPDETALAAFKNCVTENGVTVADGDNWFRELDRTDATVAAAVEKCQPLLPAPNASASN